MPVVIPFLASTDIIQAVLNGSRGAVDIGYSSSSAERFASIGTQISPLPCLVMKLISSGLTAEAPFCSSRCAQVDLNRWLTESYRIPVAPAGEGDEEDYVAWAETWEARGGVGWSLRAAPIDVGPLLNELFYDTKQAVVFTSATLSVAGHQGKHGLNGSLLLCF